MSAAATQTKPQDATTEEPLSLTEKLVAAALDVENVPKAGKNTQQNYSYAKAEDIVAAATKALLGRGVLAEFECIDSTATPIKSRQGSDGLIVTVRCRLVVTDSETGDTLCREAMGSGSDYPGDKAIYKAMTGARKYAFIHLLDIPIGDDPEAHRPEANGRGAQAKRAAVGELPEDRVNAIRESLKGKSWGEIDLVMGAVGADAPKVHRVDSLLKTIREMGEERAEALEKLLAGETA